MPFKQNRTYHYIFVFKDEHVNMNANANDNRVLGLESYFDVSFFKRIKI